VLAGTGLLAACGPQPPATEKAAEATPPPAEPTAAPTEKATEAPTPAPAEARELGLLLVDWNDAFRTVLEKEIIPAFQEANPGLTVLPDFTGWGDLDTKVMTAFAGGLAPDVFQADCVEWAPKYYPMGIVAELDASVEAAGGPSVLSDFYTKAVEEGAKLDGKLVGIPYVLDNRGLFVRKDFLKEVGLDPEKPPANWSEFRQAAVKMTKRTDDTWERAGFHSNTGQFQFQSFVPLLWQNGGSILNDAMDKVAFNSPEGVEALALWVDMIRKDKVGPVENMANVGDLDPFAAGTRAMAFGGYWTITNVRDYAPDVLPNIGVTVMTQKEKASLWYANTYLITKSDHVDISWRLLSFLALNDDNFLKYHEALGGLPPRKSIVQKASYLTPNHMILIEDVMNAAGSHTTPTVPFTLEVLARVDEAIEKAIRGEATPQEALDKAADEGNQIIERYKSGG